MYSFISAFLAEINESRVLSVVRDRAGRAIVLGKRDATGSFVPLANVPPAKRHNTGRGTPVNAGDRIMRHVKRIQIKRLVSTVPADTSCTHHTRPFCLFENIKSLANRVSGRDDGHDAATAITCRPIPSKLGLELYILNSGKAGISFASRPRCYWSNITLPTNTSDLHWLCAHDYSAVFPLLAGRPHFDPRTTLACLTTKEGVDNMNMINKGVLATNHRENVAFDRNQDPPLTEDHWKRIKQNNLLFHRTPAGAWNLRVLSTCVASNAVKTHMITRCFCQNHIFISSSPVLFFGH